MKSCMPCCRSSTQDSGPHKSRTVLKGAAATRWTHVLPESLRKVFVQAQIPMPNYIKTTLDAFEERFQKDTTRKECLRSQHDFAN